MSAEAPGYDAEIRDACYSPFRGGCIEGAIHGDRKGRFVDGEGVTTSTVLSAERADRFGRQWSVRTRNSTYLVTLFPGADSGPLAGLLRPGPAGGDRAPEQGSLFP